jgi:importin-9
VFTVIARLLQSEDESGGLVIGDLIIHLFRRAGESVLPVLPDLLQAMLVRMKTAQTATFLQSLIIPSAFLIDSHRVIYWNPHASGRMVGRVWTY